VGIDQIELNCGAVIPNLRRKWRLLLGLILLLLASHGLTEANKQLMNQFSNKRGSNNKHIKEKAAANKRQGESSSGSIIQGLASDEGTVPARSRRPSTLAWARVLL
jgi:hypothetical protein